jgi:hypothetical protein
MMVAGHGLKMTKEETLACVIELHNAFILLNTLLDQYFDNVKSRLTPQ